MGTDVGARWRAPWIVLVVLAIGAAAGARRSEVRVHSENPLAELISGDRADLPSEEEAIEAVRELDRDLRRLMRGECADP